MKTLLKTFCSVDGVSGDEAHVRGCIRAMVEPFADEIREDRQGNLCALRRGTMGGEKVRMVCAHMDEVGFIITYVTDDGYLKFTTVGGIDERVIFGRAVKVGKELIPGVIGGKAIHHQPCTGA